MVKLKKDLGKQEQGEITRKNIIHISRKLFGKKGYNGTSTEDILLELGLTRGALYHHFASKRDIFYAVCVEINKEYSINLEKIDWFKLKKQWHKFLDLANDREFIQIWLLDSYSVLSWEEILELDDLFIIQPLTDILKESIAKDHIRVLHIEETAQIILGMINQALLVLSKSGIKEKSTKKKNFKLIIDNYLETLEEMS